MLEIYLDERGEVAIENMEILLKAFPQYANRAVASALNSEGDRLRDLIKTAIKTGGPEGHKWEKLNPHTGVLSRVKAAKEKDPKYRLKNYKMVWRGKKGSKWKGKEYKTSILSTKTSPMAKLAGAVRYKYDPADQMVNIGFIRADNISESVFKLARILAKGFKTKITPDSRRMLFAVGFPIKKSTTTFETPARPLIEPVFREEERDIMLNIEKKFMSSILRYMEGKAKA